MFYGFLSERLPLLPSKKDYIVNRKGFHLYIDLSNRRTFLLDRPKTTLAFWGRVYGREDLSALFGSLIEGYERDGDAGKIFKHLEGDFSVILFDHQLQQAFLGTDRFVRGEIYWSSKKPVSFFTHPSLFFKATGRQATLNITPIWDRFAIGAITPPDTLYQDINTNVTGEYVRINSDGIAERNAYWSPLKVVRERLDQKIEDPEVFIKSLRQRFIEKVSEEIAPFQKLGVGLSGGMDSASILGAARSNFNGGIVAVTVGPDGPDSPDLPRARKSARLNGAQHIEYYPRPVDLE
ncbi:MAG: asparagine synthase-related protein, partial [Thermodesulfobacteriota bacterium]|nr:asparagine synthase-related protein [Thermodesulfobacteriota bacterium]